MLNVPFLVAVKYQVARAHGGVIAALLYIVKVQLLDSAMHEVAFNIPSRKMIYKTKFAIGDITISIEGNFQKGDLEVPVIYQPFLENGKTDITLRLHEKCLERTVGEKIFDSPPIWSLFRNNGTSAIRIFEQMPGFGRTLVLPKNVKSSNLYFDNPTGNYCDPFYGPTIELLMVNYLAQKRGVIIHGCGIKQEDRGIIFVGESGAGKTTLANIWSQESDTEILSDDRTIIRRQGNHFVIYGTPWHGEGKFSSPGNAKLEQIFFIQHGRKNSISEATRVRSVTQFLKCSFPPFWNAEGLKYSMDVFSDLASSVSCRTLSFKADSSIIDYVNNRTES